MLLAPGNSVSFNVASSDASPVVVEANMSGLGLTASVVDIVLGLLPNISVARASATWGPAFKEILGTVDKLHALSDTITEAEAGHYPQAAEAAVKAISGIDFLTTLGAAAHAAGLKYGITALAQVSPAALNRVMAVVGLGDLIVTSWSFFGDYFFNAHTEVHVIWTPQGSPSAIAVPSPSTIPQVQCPSISSVSVILPEAKQRITIDGSGFGQHSPYSGDSDYIELADLTGGWNAGWHEPGQSASDIVTLVVESWTDSHIIVGGFAGDYGGSRFDFNLHPGDELRVRVWNPQTSCGPAEYRLRVSG